jgi:hypothetical protein
MIENFSERVPPGTRISYYVGNLAYDCYRSPRLKLPPEVAELRQLRDAAWRASEAGEVELSQERLSEGVCRYWATGLTEAMQRAVLKDKAARAPTRRSRSKAA